MAMSTETDPHDIQTFQTGAMANTMADEKKAVESGPTGSQDIEIIPADEEPEKDHYNKASVWWMILFSGLAIGSDG